MDWRKTYPTLATVMEAGYETLSTWSEHLPPPSTDVERSVRRRLEKRRDDLLADELRKQAPAIADKLSEINAKLRSMGIKVDTPLGKL